MVCCVYYYFFDYLVLYVCIYCVRGGMHNTELLEDRGMGEKKCFVGQGQSSDVEPGEQGQGRTAFHKCMQILGKVYFVGNTMRAVTAARFVYVSSASVMK